MIVGSYESSAIMCRRVIEEFAVEKGATQHRLGDKLIELLESKKISDSLFTNAIEVKAKGNRAIHPQKKRWWKNKNRYKFVIGRDDAKKTAKDTVFFVRRAYGKGKNDKGKRLDLGINFVSVSLSP